MNLWNKLTGKYLNDPETVIISCYFNPYGSPYRTKAFKIFYDSIKHLNHRIVECVIGDAKPELETNKNISRVHTEGLLWHKEALLNKLVETLPIRFKYVLWVDADVIFVNKNWMVDAAKELRSGKKIVQLFDYCIHLNKDEVKPSFDFTFDVARQAAIASVRRPDVWRGFASNYVSYDRKKAASENYDEHGHVGFAWGARRSLLEAVPLYDKALIGGADHIIAHAAANHIPHKCITKSFTDDIKAVTDWSERFQKRVGPNGLGCVNGVLYHIWHGDIEKRDYLRRIKDFTPLTKGIYEKDKNGLYVSSSGYGTEYIKTYFKNREVLPGQAKNHHSGRSDRTTVVKNKPKMKLGRPNNTSFASRNRSGDDDSSLLTNLLVADSLFGQNRLSQPNFESVETREPNRPSVEDSDSKRQNRFDQYLEQNGGGKWNDGAGEKLDGAANESTPEVESCNFS